jgi:hypothetical protein
MSQAATTSNVLIFYRRPREILLASHASHASHAKTTELRLFQ